MDINSDNRIDLSVRKRNSSVENNCQEALEYLNIILKKIKNIKYEIDKKVFVIDDLGLGKTEIQYTFGAIFAQANRHAIHHYAIINYILDSLGITLNDNDFGYGPTTPKTATLN